jgi:flavin-dependent dehydrogenase
MAAEDRNADVAVIGAGPVGLSYAMWLREKRPETRIVVLERRSTPGYKIGESLLLATVNSLYSLGFTKSLMRRLFQNKAGLQFWYIDAESEGLGTESNRHIDIMISETFQVERRPFELAFQNLARRQGIEIRTGANVRIEDSTLSVGRSELVYETEAGATESVAARLVCDASGPRSVIPQALGVWRKPEGHVDANAYWGYFRRKTDPDIEFWRSGASRQICFPEGWVWFIPICSWEQASDDGLNAMIDSVLDSDAPDEEIPARAELSERFGCPYQQIMSIGIVPRDDMDESKSLPPDERFRFYLERYPALGGVLDHFELVEGIYDKLPPFLAAERMIHDSDRYAGDGWIAVGDAGVFVNPIFSPGVGFGMSTAHMAVEDTVSAFERDDLSPQRFSAFEDYVRLLFDALVAENDMLYRGFRHRDSYERALLVKFFSGIKDAARAGAAAAAAN